MKATRAVDIVTGAGASEVTNRTYMGGWTVFGALPNGYGLSVIENSGSYGLEMAVCHPDRLCYATPVTDYVLGWLSEDTLRAAVHSVAALPENATCTHARSDDEDEA